MAAEYDRKFEEMKNYVPFLESMIKRLESTSGSTNPRQAQLDKIRSLRDLLLDKKKRMKMENLLKCEQVLVNLYAKVEQRDTLPGIDLKVPTNIVKVKDEPDLDAVRNKLKIVTMREELPDTLPEIARANDTQDTSTAGAKEPALFQRRPNMMGVSSTSPSIQSQSDSKNPQPKRNYTRVLVSPEPSPQRWSKQEDKITEKPLFSRRSPRRQSPTHRKDRKQSKQRNSPKSNLNITLKVPEESLDSLNTTDIFSRIINCRDNDVDITTLRELRSQILGELKHTGANDDISDLILNSSKKKRKKKNHKRKEEVEEGELSDSESEAIENIYGSLVILDKDQNTSGQTKLSNKLEQKPRKIQIRLVINSENETGSSDSPNASEKRGLISDLSDVSELEMFESNKESKSTVTPNKEVTIMQIQSNEVAKYDEEIAPKASELPDEEIAPKASELPDDNSPQKTIPVTDKKSSCSAADTAQRKESIALEADKNTKEKDVNEKISFKPNFYKPITDHNQTDNKEKKMGTHKNLTESKDIANIENASELSSDKKESVIDKNVKSVDNIKENVPKKICDDVEIPLLHEQSVASRKPKESVVSEIDILQALKNEILSDSIAIPVADPSTPALHQPKVMKVANTEEIAPKKRISIEKYKQKSTPKPAVKPLFTSQSSLKDKDDNNKKQSLKLTEKECERFKFALDNDLSSDDDDIFDDLNKSDDDDDHLAPKSPDNDESSNIETNVPVIIPVDPVKNVIASSNADVDMRTLIPVVAPVATATPAVHSVIDAKQNIAKIEINRPSDPRLKRDTATLNILNEQPKPVPLPVYPNITSTISVGIAANLVSSLTPNPSMTPNMTPIRAPNMTPIMTPNSRSFEIDDQPKRKHVYATLYDSLDFAEDTQRPHWEKPDKTSREPKWEPNDDKERNQHLSMQDRVPKSNQDQNYNRYSDSRSFYRDDNSGSRLDPQIPLYKRTEAPMTPSHPFGRSDCPPTPSHPFGRSDCPPTPVHSFGRTECPPTPSHPFGRSECPPTPNHPFGRSECPPTPSHPFGRLECPSTPNHHYGRSDGTNSSHSFGRSECPMTPSHPFGRSECPPTPSHSFGRSECPTTPIHSFGRSEMPMTPSHPFGRLDRDPRLKKTNENENNIQNDDRQRRYLKDQSSYKPYNPKHDLSNKTYNVDNYRNYREQSVVQTDTNRSIYYKEQSGRQYNEERVPRHESSNRLIKYDNEQYKPRGQKSDNEYYQNNNSTRFRETETRSKYQRERSVGRTNSGEDRLVRSNSRARSVGRNPDREEENTLSVKPHAGRSFIIDTSVNSTFQDFMKSNKEKSIFDQLFDRKKRASSVGRTFIRETSVGRSMSRPLNSMDNEEIKNDRFRRARSVVKETIESKSFSEIKADFESYRYKANAANNRNNAMQSKKPLDQNNPLISKNNDIQSRKKFDSKQPYSPRKNYRDPRLNRDSHHESRNKQKEDKYRSDPRDMKKHGIIYSNDNIASGTILGSGYGVKNYKIPKIKRVEEIPPVALTTDKPETALNKQGKSIVKEDKDKKTVGGNKNKEKYKKSDEKESKRIDNVKTNVENSAKRLKKSIKKSESEEPKVADEEVVVKTRRSRKLIKDSESESEDVDKNIKKDTAELPQKSQIEKKESPKDEKSSCKNSLDADFGMDDLDIFSDNIVSDPVINKIDSLIADLDDDINTSKNVSAGKFTNEIDLENMLENITCQSANQGSIDCSIDSALQEINKLIGNDESQIDNMPTKETDMLQISQENKVNEDVLIKPTKDVIVSDISSNIEKKIESKNVEFDIPKTDENLQTSKDADATVSTTENVMNKLNDEKQDHQHVARSTTPDSTNIDTVQSLSGHVSKENIPDSTEEGHGEISEVSSSNTSAQIASKDSEPKSSLIEESSTSDPLGNILTILQSKSKIKELLSMLGDQSSENDKIKKKLKKLSEIVSDDDDTKDDLEDGMDQESRNDTEMECKDNEQKSKDEPQQELLKNTQVETESKDSLIIKDNVDKECHNEETHTDDVLDNSKVKMTSSDNQSECAITLKQNKTLKKKPVKMRRKRNRKYFKKVLVGDEKRVTRSELNVQKSAPNTKRMSRELLQLQEDLKEMFISDDVLNVTGIRMCRLAKLVDENSQKDVTSKTDTEPVVVLEKINKNDSFDAVSESKGSKIKTGLAPKKKPGPKSKVRMTNASSGDVEENSDKSNNVPKYKPGPKSKTKSLKPQVDVDPYDFETDSINESNTSKISESSVRDSSDSENESLASINSFGSSEALSELKTLSELKKKPKRKRSSWKTGVIKPKNKKKKPEQKVVECVSKMQSIDETQHINIPDFNCFIDKKYCYAKNVFTYSCRLCVYSGEEIVAHYKKEHPHTEIPLSRLSPEVAKEAIEQCEEMNFQAISKIPTDKYVCRFCYKEFGKKKAALESFFWHVVSMHTGEYKQICSECVNITRCPFNLDIPPPPKDIKGQLIGYICGKCNFTQISLENLKTHVIVRHNDEQTEVYTINLAVMSRKIINILSKRVSVPEIDQPRVLRSSRSNQSMTEMSDDHSDMTESNSCVTEPENIKDEIQNRAVKDIRKLSTETKSKLQSKITFETDETDTCNVPVKFEREELEDENREEINTANEPIAENSLTSASSVTIETPRDGVSKDIFTHPHFNVNYTEIGTGIELICFINDGSDFCHYKSHNMNRFRTHVRIKHRDQKWNGYCFMCKDFVNPQGKYLFQECISHFYVKHVDSTRYFEDVSDVNFGTNYSDTGIKQFICTIDGNVSYQCSAIMTLKKQVSLHKRKWNGYCIDCKEFVKPRGENCLADCLTHYLIKHNLDSTSVSAPATTDETSSCSPDDNQIAENAVSNDIFPHPHFKVTYTETGSKEFVCCINQTEGVHYKTPLLISMKKHVQMKHSDNWDGYCTVCKVIVMPQGRHMFKDCLQHFLDKHMDDFPVLEKVSESENLVAEPAPGPRPYINVRPLSQLKDIDTEDRDLVLPKIESVVSLGATSEPTSDYSGPLEAEVIEPEPEPEPEPQIEEFHNYEASQAKVMSQKHPVVQEAMIRKEKLVRVYKCAGSFCSFATDSADLALSHALTHQKIGGDNALFCAYCDFDCAGNAIDLVVHVFKHGACPFSCGYCFYRAAAAQLVVAHSNTMHVGKPVKVYIAKNAPIPEKNSSKMLTREAVVQYYVCNHEEFDSRCKFKTYTARKFCDHLQTRHTGEHSCYICTESLPTPSDLIQHMKCHDLNLYQCTWCVHGADSEAELLSHAASTHPTQLPQAYLRIITNKDGSSEMRVLPLASFNKSSVGVEYVTHSAHPENPIKEAERSIDLEKLIGQTKLMFETITSSTEKSAEATPNVNDMATISPAPAKTPPRPEQPDITEQTTPILKSEPAEIAPSKITDEIVCLDSDEETETVNEVTEKVNEETERVNEETAIVNEERTVNIASDVNISTDEEGAKAASIILDDQVFKCPKCLTCFRTDTGLKLHILRCYNPNWPMACPHCHKMTENREALVQHYFIDHCKKYTCAYCNREMHTLKIAKQHMKAMHKVTKVNVVYGKDSNVVEKDTAEPTRAPPKRKLSMNTSSAPPPKQPKRYGPQDVDRLPINPILDDLVYCSLCEFNTKVRLNMVRHLQLHAEQQPVPQTAPVNPVPHLETNEMHFDRMVNLASSSLAKEKPKEVGPIVSQIPPEAAARYPKYVPERQRYTCGAKDCSYISVDEEMLRCHWDTLHSGSTDYRCVHCPPYQHLDKSKPLIAARIMMHLKMHDTALYACSSCTYYHFKRQVVEKHINDVHKGTGQLLVVREEAAGPLVPAAGHAPTMDLKPWQCGLCKFKSMLRAEVAEHCYKHHQSKMQYKCAYCPFRTSTLENVVKHQTNSHPGRPEEIFYYYYREGSVSDEDGSPKWMMQRQKMGITEDPVVKTETEASEGAASKPDSPVPVAAPVVDLNIVKKEVEQNRLEGELSVEELCSKFGQFCEPNGLKYKCSLCAAVTEDSREAMQSHLYEELQYRKWRCSICSYKAFHKNGLHDHISTEHRGRMQEPLPINLPVDVNIERWVAELLLHQTTIIEKNKQNLLGQKVQTPGPSGLNAPQRTPEKPVETPVRVNFSQKELEDAFGPLGVAVNKEYCCPKCAFKTDKEDAMREHLESELSKIRWCCSHCSDNFQIYHEALTHCRARHDGQSARPKEALRDQSMRAAWVTTSIQTQKRTITTENIQSSRSLLRNMESLVGQKVQTINTSEKPNPALKSNMKELEDAFGQFGVANNKEFCCPKCIFRAKDEDVMKEHLETELTKIRWCCSNCPEKFQTYHEAQFHCKAHDAGARPREAARDPGLRTAWLRAVIQVQRQGMHAPTNERLEASPNKNPPQDPEDSLLVVRYEEKVPIPEPSTSRTIPEPPIPADSSSPESDDEKLIIDEEFALKRVGKVTVCPYCSYQSKHRVTVRDHVYRHFGLYPVSCGYCEFSGYRASVTAHLESIHPHEPKKFKVTPLPKGKPTVADVKNRRMRRKVLTSEWRFCLLCQVTFNVEKAATHTHGDAPGVFVKHGDIVVNCRVCETLRKDFALMEEHYATLHPDKPRNYFVYQILYNSMSNEYVRPTFKRIHHSLSETVIDLNEDDNDNPPPKKVARKSTTKLPMQTVAKKSTTKLPCLYISEDEEYSFYGTKPDSIDSYENVTTLMTFCNTLMPFTVKKLSEIIQMDPRVVVKDLEMTE